MPEFTSWMTACSAAVVATLAAWRWGYEEWRKWPALDGNTTVEVLHGEDGKAYAKIDSEWNNKSLVPILLNREGCTFLINELSSERTNDTVILTRKRIQEIRPILGEKPYLLEPGTESHIQASVALLAGPIYEVVARISIDKVRRPSVVWKKWYDPEVYWWERIQIFSSALKEKSTSGRSDE